MTTRVSKKRKVDRSNGQEYKDPSLLPKHKIFLSHSGAQKEEFVEQLCVDLERRHRFPFYDKRPSSLPKGERFPNIIKDAVAQCEMLVVVVSEEYFTSKWPMIELHAFMQACRKNSNLRVLPLFFGLNVDEFSNSRRQKRWLKVWKEMAKGDKRIKVDEWKQCVKWMGAFNGLVYDRGSKEIVTYRKDIVSMICKAIPADIKYDESHVQGRFKLSQVVRQHFENIPSSVKMPGVRVMGLYGVGGIGKTQICKLMCNELEREFDGKVCHVELGHESEHKLIQKVLITLTNTSVEVLQEVRKDKCRDILLDINSWSQRTFLTIDNVWDDGDSLEQFKLFLRAPFAKGSWVLVTSRFKRILGLEVDENACFEMPELDKDDARDMFWHHATNGAFFENEEDVEAIDKCIQSCYFVKGEGQGSHYHPLSLKALGLFIYRHGGKQPCMWVKNLPKLKDSSYSREPKNPLFTVLRTNFDRLPKGEQELFMDIALFRPPQHSDFKPNMRLFTLGSLMEWLCLVHNKEEEVIEDWLQHLVENALVEGVDMSSGNVSIHDLYHEFAELESQGKLMPLDAEERKWLYVVRDELEEPQNCCNKLTRICISNAYRNGSRITMPRTIEWTYYKKLVVLKLDNLCEYSGVLNCKDLICLRSLTLDIQMDCALDSIEGLEGLKTLTYFRIIGPPSVFYLNGFISTHPKVGQLPAALKVLNVEAAVFKRDVLALCTNLVSLKMCLVHISELDLKNCTSLCEVELICITGLKVLRGFTSALRSSLRLLNIRSCANLVEVGGLDCLAGLLTLHLEENGKLSKLPSLSGMKSLHTLHCVGLDIDEVPGLDDLVGLESLQLIRLPRVSKLPSFTGLACLRGLNMCFLGISELPNLSGLEQLQDLTVGWNSQLTRLQGFGHLPALKWINLRSCHALCQLPDMSEVPNLKYLHLGGTQVTCLKDLHLPEGVVIELREIIVG